MKGRLRSPLIPDDFEDDLLIVSVLGLIASLFLSLLSRHWLPDYYPHLVESAAICLTWITTVGASRAAAAGVHVRITLFADLMPKSPRWRMEMFADIVMLVVGFALFGISCMLVHYSLTHPAPRGHPLVYAAMPVGMGLAMYRLCQRIARGWRERA
jgi:TRAP-type C4-dicarboxylate transport system permease small subunit